MLFLVFNAYAQDWGRDVVITAPRENIYQLKPQELQKKIMEGRRVALFYPVTISDLMIPYQPVKTFFESAPTDPVRRAIYDLARVVTPMRSMHDLYKWLGLHDFPLTAEQEGPNPFPELSIHDKELPMGATLMHTEDGEALTFGCAACHAGNLFGTKIMGLTNRFPRANEFFAAGKTYAPYINSFLFKDLLRSTEGERLMMLKAKTAVKWIGTKEPAVLGLDTSVAQVSLSLSRREKDPYATRTERSAMFPRPNKLSKLVADAKPAVWWNVKYKNRWLSDGSVISGNPVHTNFIWNEIGRGSDLNKLETWMDQDLPKIQALTAAVFASKAPRYETFFGAKSINIEKAQRGQKHFVQSCQKCHGVYQKGWDSVGASKLSYAKLIQNTKIIYHQKTPVINIGTDPGRYMGMEIFAEDFNRLQIAKNLKTIVEPQKGYVPPPLEGIWSRWPYFHNNSIPNLCALLTKASMRPVTYVSGEAINKDTDFDQDCVGYPLGEKAPAEWSQNKDFLYDTRREGLSNSGHDEGIILKNGREIYSEVQKIELIEFLKTL